MNDKYERQMKKGFLDMLVLKFLTQSPHYGYQLITEIKEKSNETFSLKEGTLYPILYRLEEEELIQSQWSEAKAKQLPRKYYVITEKGISALRRMVQTWNRISSEINHIMEDFNYDDC